MAVSAIGIGWRHPHYRELLEGIVQPNAQQLTADASLFSNTLDVDLAPDFLEVHSENFFGNGGAALAVLEQGRALYPISLHGVGLALGSAIGVDDWHLDQLAQLVQRIEPVRVSDHVCFARGSITSNPQVGEHNTSLTTVHGADLFPIPFNQEALAVMATNVQRVQDRLKRPIAVENLSAYITFAGSEMTEPEFLNALAKRTGCQLLVDVNNIYVNALNNQICQGLRRNECTAITQCSAWLDAIDATQVAEIHLAGHMDCGDIVVDDHGSCIQAPVWAVYEHAIVRFGDTPSLIEWDTDIPALGVLLEEAARARQIADKALTKVLA